MSAADAPPSGNTKRLLSGGLGSKRKTAPIHAPSQEKSISIASSDDDYADLLSLYVQALNFVENGDFDAASDFFNGCLHECNRIMQLVSLEESQIDAETADIREKLCAALNDDFYALYGNAILFSALNENKRAEDANGRLTESFAVAAKCASNVYANASDAAAPLNVWCIRRLHMLENVLKTKSFGGLRRFETAAASSYQITDMNLVFGWESLLMVDFVANALQHQISNDVYVDFTLALVRTIPEAASCAPIAAEPLVFYAAAYVASEHAIFAFEAAKDDADEIDPELLSVDFESLLCTLTKGLEFAEHALLLSNEHPSKRQSDEGCHDDPHADAQQQAISEKAHLMKAALLSSLSCLYELFDDAEKAQKALDESLAIFQLFDAEEEESEKI